MKYCIYCGAKLLDDDKFCPECGEKVYDMDAFMEEIKMPEAPVEEEIIESTPIEEPQEVIEEEPVEEPKQPEKVIDPVVEEVEPVEEPVAQEIIEEPVVEEEPVIEETPIEEPQEVIEEEPIETIPEEPKIVEEEPVEEPQEVEEPVQKETPVVDTLPFGYSSSTTYYQGPVYVEEDTQPVVKEEPKTVKEEDVQVTYKKDSKAFSIILLLISLIAFGVFLGVDYTFKYSFFIAAGAAALSFINFIISLVKKAKKDNPQDKHFYGVIAIICLMLLAAAVIVPVLDDVLSNRIPLQ